MAELFRDFEVNKTPRWRRMTCALAGTFALHIAFVAAILYVPSIQAALSLVGAFSGADYVSEDYERTQIRERAQIIKIGGKFQYPEGYFNIFKHRAPDANLIAEARPKPTPKATPKPTPKPSPTPSPEPSPQLAQKDAKAGDKTQQGANGNDKTQQGTTLAPSAASDDVQKQAAEADKVAERMKVKKFPPINSKPFKDLLARANEQKQRGELDLSGVIQMTIEADRNEDGTLSNVTMVGGSTSNAALKELAKEFVSALSASHALSVLEDAHHLRMNFRADSSSISVRATTKVASAARADEMAKGYGMLIFGARLTRPENEREVYRNTTVSANGDEVTVKFDMPRQTATQMIQKQLAKNE